MDERGLQAVALEAADIECPSEGINAQPIRAGGTERLGDQRPASRATLDFLMNDF